MVLHMFVVLLVVCLLLCLALFRRLDWFPLRSSSSRGGAKRTTLQRLLKPRTPDDCSACRLASTPASTVVPAPVPVRVWREVKSRRGAPKRVNTEGYACSNQKCLYFGITDAQIHALVSDGKHGQTEHIQTFRCQACRSTFTSRRNTPLYRLKTPSQQIAMVLSALAEGLDPSSAERVAGLSSGHYHEPFSLVQRYTRTLCTSDSSAISTSRTSSWTNCAPASAVPNTRSGSGWPSIPAPAILPVLQLGPRTQHMAHRLIHSLRRNPAAFLLAALHQ
jgi:hypothetical protein